MAGVKTRAVKDGDEWVINGQKVWTTGAQVSDYGILLTRTDPKAFKHKGLTMFIVNMKDPAVEVRPIHQASGGREFNEVYFTDLRVPDSDRLGEPGQGWKVAIVTLMNERLAVGGSPGPDWGDHELCQRAGHNERRRLPLKAGRLVCRRARLQADKIPYTDRALKG